MPDKKPPNKGGLLTKKYGGVKGSYWLLGGAAVAGAGYIYYKREAAAAQQTDTSPTTTDPSIDPNTGLPYDEEANYGTGDTYGETPYGGYAGGGYQLGGGIDPSTGLPWDAEAISQLAAAINPATSTTVTERHPTNLSWLRHAEKRLKAEGYHSPAVAAALASYLAGIPLTKHQETIVRAAIGAVGVPPATPPRVHTAPAAQHRGVHHPRKHKKTVHRVSGKRKVK